MRSVASAVVCMHGHICIESYRMNCPVVLYDSSDILHGLLLASSLAPAIVKSYEFKACATSLGTI